MRGVPVSGSIVIAPWRPSWFPSRTTAMLGVAARFAARCRSTWPDVPDARTSRNAFATAPPLWGFAVAPPAAADCTAPVNDTTPISIARTRTRRPTTDRATPPVELTVTSPVSSDDGPEYPSTPGESARTPLGRLGRKEAGRVHGRDPGQVAAHHGRGGQPARRPPRDVATHLDHHLERRTRGDGEEEHRQEVAHEKAADPRAEDRRGPGDQGEDTQPGNAGPGRAFRDRRRDPEALGQVVDHEAHDQERPQRELAEGQRRADGQALAEVVDADPDRDQRCQAEPSQRLGAVAAARQPGRDQREAQ